MKPKRHIGLALALLLAGAAHSAPDVWRCGSDGARVYADQPCPEGRAIQSERDPGQARVIEAQAVARREQTLANSLAAERRARERSASGQGPAGIRMVARYQGKLEAAEKATTHIDGKDRHTGKRKQRADGVPKDPRVSFQVKVRAAAAQRPAGPKPPPPRPQPSP